MTVAVDLYNGLVCQCVCSWDIGGGEQFCDISGKKVKVSHGVNGFIE